MSPGLHSFLTAVESGCDGFHPKNFLCGICIQQSGLVAFQCLVWGTIWTAGRSELVVCDGNVNAEKYISILNHGLLPAFRSWKLRHRFTLFMQDGAPYHTAKNTKDWLAKEGIKCLPWPSPSPDMNPIEDLWAILDHILWGKPTKPSSKEDLDQLRLRSVRA